MTFAKCLDFGIPPLLSLKESRNHPSFFLLFGYALPQSLWTSYVVCSLARRALNLGGVSVEAVHFQLERPDLAAEPVVIGFLVRILFSLKI